MDFDFSQEQRAIAEEARRVLADAGDAASRRSVFEAEAPFNRALWTMVCDLGWPGAAIAEEHGGLALDRSTLCLLAEELGRVLAPIPFSSSIFLAAEAIALAATAEQQAAWLPSLASGARIGTLAIVEGAGPIDATRMTCRLSEGRLYGEKIAVVDAMVADLAVVVARDETGPVLALAELGGGGVARVAQPAIDPSRPLGRIRFEGASAIRLDGWARPGSAIDSLLARAAIFVAFEQLGGAQAALDAARAYALQRHAFGRPIGSFQAIKHLLAETHVAIELARSHALHAAWAIDGDDTVLPVAASSVRIAATAAFEQAARNIIQVHGGIGMTWEHDAHLFYRRSRHLALLLGDSAQWRDTLIDELVAARG